MLEHTAAIILALTGWFLVHMLNSCRDKNNKRREIRLGHLIDTYFNLTELERTLNKEISDEINNALQRLQLFGNEQQIKQMVKFTQMLSQPNPTDSLKKKRSQTFADLMESLRDDIRNELNMVSINSTRLILSPNKANSAVAKSCGAPRSVK